MDKNDYYRYLKIRSGGQLEARAESRVGLIIDLGQHKDKIIIIIVLKLNLRADSGPDSDHRSS